MAIHIMTATVETELRHWKVAFMKRWELQPPEFFYSNGTGSEDLYSRNIGTHVNPVNSPWYEKLLLEATVLDLTALEDILGPPAHPQYACYLRFFQKKLLIDAKEAHDAKRPYSAAIPTWFRSQGWRIGPLWDCEKELPAGHPVLAAMRREDAAAAAGAGAGASAATDSETAWQRAYAEQREKLQAAREAVREAEELLYAHMAMRP
jgi:hypothetical protein